MGAYIYAVSGKERPVRLPDGSVVGAKVYKYQFKPWCNEWDDAVRGASLRWMDKGRRDLVRYYKLRLGRWIRMEEEGEGTRFWVHEKFEDGAEMMEFKVPLVYSSDECGAWDHAKRYTLRRIGDEFVATAFDPSAVPEHLRAKYPNGWSGRVAVSA